MFARLTAHFENWLSSEKIALPNPRLLPAWVLSFALHVFLLVAISLASFTLPLPFELTLTTAEAPIETIPEEFHFSNEVQPEMGANSVDGLDVAMASSPELADVMDIVQQPDSELFEIGEIQFTNEMELATTPLDTSKKLIHGVAGLGVTGANGAIDRITHEILLSMEDRNTLVVWLFDQSGSLVRQRAEIRERLKRIYDELGIVNSDIKNPNSNRQPLLTSVMAFGQKPAWMIQKPTADVDAIQNAVANIRLDDSGIENVFSSIYLAAEEVKRWRSRRNIMLIAVTDEVGDDYEAMLENTVEQCRKYAMPVYVLGVPAAFGRAETLLKWIDPDPKYNQKPRWGRVNQGPESLRPEQLHLPFAGAPDEAIDSGFGPFALTRLCYQTGGIYFTIHPNRKTGRRVGRSETEAFSSHLSYFFEPQRMRAYRPDYVSKQEYDLRAKANPARTALLLAAQRTVERMENPQRRFVKRDDAQFASELTESQKAAAKLEPKVRSLFEILKQGESGRVAEQTLRWQAAYDLAYGQTLAVLVRTRAYNEMLAQAKRGLKAEKENSNTWTLVPADELSTSSRLERDAERAREYLERITDEHEGTPWALLAQRELSTPMGWSWKESFTPIERRNPGAAANNDNPRPPRDDEKRMLPKPPPTRDIPKL